MAFGNEDVEVKQLRAQLASRTRMLLEATRALEQGCTLTVRERERVLDRCHVELDHTQLPAALGVDW